MLTTTLRPKGARSASYTAGGAQVSKLRSSGSRKSGTAMLFMVRTARPVDLSAFFWLGGSGSRVVSTAKRIVTRWRAECGRSDYSSRVNAIDSAGRTPKRVTVAKWSWRRTLAGRFWRECRPEAPQLPSTGVDLDLGDVEATIASLRSELSQKPPAEVLREREDPSGAKTKLLCAVPARSWPGIIEATLVVSRESLPRGSAGACEEAGSLAHGCRAPSPSLLGYTHVSRSVRLRDEGIDWLAPACRVVCRRMSQTQTNLSMA